MLAVELWGDPKTGKSTVRMAVTRLRRAIDKYYKSREGKTAIIIVDIPDVGGWDPHTGILHSGVNKHYHADISFHPMMLDAAKNFSNALYLKYDLPLNEGEAWFDTGREPRSLVALVRHMEGRKAALKNLLSNSFLADPAIRAREEEKKDDAQRDSTPPANSQEEIERVATEGVSFDAAKLAEVLLAQIVAIADSFRKRDEAIRFIRIFLQEQIEESNDAGSLLLQRLHDVEALGKQSPEAYAAAALDNTSTLLSLMGQHKRKRAAQAMLEEMDSEALAQASPKKIVRALERVLAVVILGEL